MGGLSLLMLVFTLGWMRLGNGIAWHAQFAWAAGILVWVINWPHFAATIFRLYARKSTRDQYPVTAYLAPLFVVAGVVLCFVDPEFWAVTWVRLFLIWSPYHYSGQTIGITRLYAKRAAWNLTRWEGRLLSTMVYASFIAPILVAEGSRGGGGFYYAIQLPPLGLSPWLGRVATGVLILSTVGWLAAWGLRRYREGGGAPWICLVPGVAQLCWFNLLFANYLFMPFVPLFHSLQYLFLAWMLELQERLVLATTRARSIWSASAFWYAVCFLLGALLFNWIPHALWPWTGQSAHFVEGVFIVGVQIHHFLVDGVIWRLRDPQLASPLKVHWSEFAPVDSRPRANVGIPVAVTAVFLLALLIPRSAGAEQFGAFEPERYVLLETTTGNVLVSLNSDQGGTRFEQEVIAGTAGRMRGVRVETTGIADTQILAYADDGSDVLVLHMGTRDLLSSPRAVGEIKKGLEAVSEMARIRLDGSGRPQAPLSVGRVRFVPPEEVDSIAWHSIPLPAHVRRHGSTKRFIDGFLLRWVIASVCVLSGIYLLLRARGVSSMLESALGIALICTVALLIAAALLPKAREGSWAGIGVLACLFFIVRVCNRIDRKAVI